MDRQMYSFFKISFLMFSSYIQMAFITSRRFLYIKKDAATSERMVAMLV